MVTTWHTYSLIMSYYEINIGRNLPNTTKVQGYILLVHLYMTTIFTYLIIHHHNFISFISKIACIKCIYLPKKRTPCHLFPTKKNRTTQKAPENPKPLNPPAPRFSTRTSPCRSSRSLRSFHRSKTPPETRRPQHAPRRTSKAKVYGKPTRCPSIVVLDDEEVVLGNAGCVCVFFCCLFYVQVVFFSKRNENHINSCKEVSFCDGVNKTRCLFGAR